MNRFLPEVCPTQTQMPLDFGGDPERDPGQTISFMIACCPICGGNYYIYMLILGRQCCCLLRVVSSFILHLWICTSFIKKMALLSLHQRLQWTQKEVIKTKKNRNIPENLSTYIQYFENRKVAENNSKAPVICFFYECYFSLSSSSSFSPFPLPFILHSCKLFSPRPVNSNGFKFTYAILSREQRGGKMQRLVASPSLSSRPYIILHLLPRLL